MKNPYEIVKKVRVTEKTEMLKKLKDSSSNPSIRKFKSPKVVFDVASDASKPEIKMAIEEIYRDKGVKVKKVNTINIKPKERRVRGRVGMTSAYKKAVVTFSEGDLIDEGT